MCTEVHCLPTCLSLHFREKKQVKTWHICCANIKSVTLVYILIRILHFFLFNYLIAVSVMEIPALHFRYRVFHENSSLSYLPSGTGCSMKTVPSATCLQVQAVSWKRFAQLPAFKYRVFHGNSSLSYLPSGTGCFMKTVPSATCLQVQGV